MKKLLAGTTALIAVGTLAGAAQAADPIKLSVGGMMNQWIGIIDSDDETYDSTNNLGIIGDTEVQFSGSTVLDNGLKIAVNINLEAERINNWGGRNADQSYMTLSGGWGQVRVGEMKNAATIVHNSAPGAGAAFSDVGAFATAPVAGAVTTMADFGTSVDGIADAGKSAAAIDYISPMFGPFAFGITYTPEVFGNGTAQEGNSTKDLLGAAFVYADKWGPVSVNADVAYARFEAVEGGTTGASRQNGMAHGVPVGLKLGYAGFEVGGSYFRIMDNVKVSSTPTVANANGLSYDGHAWDAGISYTTGPWKFGYQYFSSSLEGAVSVHGKDTVHLHNGGGQYTMGPGVVVTANVFHINQKDEADLSTGRSERATMGLVTGLLLTF